MPIFSEKKGARRESPSGAATRKKEFNPWIRRTPGIPSAKSEGAGTKLSQRSEKEEKAFFYREIREKGRLHRAKA